MTVEEQVSDFESLFRRYSVDIAYLFGSHATGTAHENSDVDIGVVFRNPGEGSDQLPQLERRLSEKLERPVDCRQLTDADPRFVYTVLRTGEPVFVADEDRRREFEYRSMRTYLDLKPMYDEYDRYVRRRVTS